MFGSIALISRLTGSKLVQYCCILRRLPISVCCCFKTQPLVKKHLFKLASLLWNPSVLFVRFSLCLFLAAIRVLSQHIYIFMWCQPHFLPAAHHCWSKREDRSSSSRLGKQRGPETYYRGRVCLISGYKHSALQSLLRQFRHPCLWSSLRDGAGLV